MSASIRDVTIVAGDMVPGSQRFVPLAALATALIGAVALPAAAQDATSRIGQCYARTYDAAHLRDHAGQDVVRISAMFLDYEDGPAAEINFTTRGGGRYFLYGVCGDASGAIACDVCLHDGCEPTGEAFRLVPRGEDLLLSNDTTGITAVSSDGGPLRRLDPGGEHRVFLLRRAEAAACGG